MKRPITAVLLTTAWILSSCATSPEHHASYVTSAQFQTYSCEELSAEIERIQTRVNQLMGKSNDKTPSRDQWTLGSDLSLSWGALFALGGSKEQEAEYVQLKSEYDAIQQWATTKKCPGAMPPIDNPPDFDPTI